MKTLFWASTAIGAVVLTLLICANRHVGYYEDVAGFRPTLVVQESDTNACYWAKEMLKADAFSKVTHNETHDKQICLHVYTKDSANAIETMNEAVDLAMERCEEYGMTGEVTQESHIVATPSTKHYIRYAGLSLIFSFMLTGAVATGITFRKKKTT